MACACSGSGGGVYQRPQAGCLLLPGSLGVSLKEAGCTGGVWCGLGVSKDHSLGWRLVGGRERWGPFVRPPKAGCATLASCGRSRKFQPSELRHTGVTEGWEPVIRPILGHMSPAVGPSQGTLHSLPSCPFLPLVLCLLCLKASPLLNRVSSSSNDDVID